jgi:endonuclease IV
LIQRTIEEVLQGNPSVQVMLDDMAITGKDDQEHLQNLDKVLARLEEYGLRLNLDKCQFFKDSVTFCGHIIDRDFIKHQIKSKQLLMLQKLRTLHGSNRF